MLPIVSALLAYLASWFFPDKSLHLKLLALEHQLAVYKRSVRRPRLHPSDRLFWAWISRHWSGWQEALVFVQPATVIAWQRKRFRDHWSRLSRRGKAGRPAISKEVRDLIRKMSQANPIWGSPRIVGELSKLGIEVAKSTVEKYRVPPQKRTWRKWKTFLRNHVRDLVSIDFFVVATATHKVLFVLLILAHDRRRVVHFNVTEHPTAQWTAQQVVEAFPWEKAPHYMVRDRDRVYGTLFQERVHSMGIKEVVTAARCPWQNPFVERPIGSIRRECLDHVAVLSERHLKQTLISYFSYYHRWRTHLSLEMDCPEPRVVQPHEYGEVIEVAEVGGLHHHYERLAA
jgi:hypothetical protein